MVNYRQQVADEVAEARENRSSGNGGQRETVDQIDVEFDEVPFVKFYPTTAISGTFPADEGNPIIRFPDEGNNGHRHQGYLGLVLDDLSIDTEDTSEDGGFDMSDAFFARTSEDDFTEYRAVNGADEETTFQYDGDQVNISGDKYDIDERVTEIDGRAILVVDRTAAVSVARKLDVNGATLADMDEETGSPNTGLIEYAPDGEDAEVNWRYARNPELREELYGQEVTVLVSRRAEIDNEETGYVGEDGDPSSDDPVLGGDSPHNNSDEASYAELVAADEARDMMWYSVFDEEGNALSPVEGEATGYSFLEWRFDPSVGRLPDDEYEFVVTYEREGLPTDEDTILDNVRENFDDANEQRIVELIQNDNDHEL